MIKDSNVEEFSQYFKESKKPKYQWVKMIHVGKVIK